MLLFFFLILQLDLFLLFYVSVCLYASMYVHHVCTRCQRKLERCTGSRTGVTMVVSHSVGGVLQQLPCFSDVSTTNTKTALAFTQNVSMRVL